MEQNVLGLSQSLPGPGHPTQFTPEDVCCAKVTVEVMNTLGSISIARAAVELFRNQPDRRTECIIIYMKDRDYEINWSGRVWPTSDSDAKVLGRQSSTGDNAIVLIPVPQIVFSVQELFNGLKEEKQSISA